MGKDPGRGISDGIRVKHRKHPDNAGKVVEVMTGSTRAWVIWEGETKAVHELCINLDPLPRER